MKKVLAFGANCDGCLGVGKSPEDEDMSVFLLPDAPLNLNCHDMEGILAFTSVLALPFCLALLYFVNHISSNNNYVFC